MKAKSLHLSKDNQQTFLLWISIIYAMQWLHSLFYELSSGTYFQHFFAGYSQPFILSVLLIGVFLSFGKKIGELGWHSIETQLLIVSFVFVFVEIFHFPKDYSIFEQFKHVFYSKLISSIISISLLIAIFEIVIGEIKKIKFLSILASVISVKAIITIFVSMLAVLGVISTEANEHIYNSSQSYESLTLIIIIIFNEKISGRLPSKYFLVFLNAIPMFFFQCRGAIFIFLCIFLIYLLKIVYCKIIKEQKKMLLLTGVIFIFGFIHVFIINIFGVDFFNKLIRSEKAGRLRIEMIQSKEIFNGVLSVAKYLKKNKCAERINVVDGSDANITNQTLSSISRIGTIILGLNSFAHNPLFGIGSEKSYALSVEGYGIHSFIPLLLSSYGLVGFIPFCLFCVNLIFKYTVSSNNYFNAFVFTLYLLMVMVFINSFVWWYGFMFVLSELKSIDFDQKRQNS